MKTIVTKKLENMIVRLNKKIEEACDVREEIMQYLEDNYEINTDQAYDDIEDDHWWCSGINEDTLRRIITKGEYRWE